MAKAWYILHVYSGYENKIEKTIRVMMSQGELSRDIISDIRIPSEEVIDVKDGKRRSSSRKILPGYLMIEMDLPDDSWKATCSAIRKITGVTGFVGGSPTSKPQPISQDEAKDVFQRTGEIKGERQIRTRQSFSQGEHVKIIEGPFESFTGVIEEVYPEKNKLKVMVGIFGRSTPVEVDILQVEKV